ncbi:MAG: T9SS type A sorting domain-containing protein [Bacteroidaceae bacterium]|nr:T9SS type A sorting domain-containing protein [Bacteroidaceae bacterium]
MSGGACGVAGDPSETNVAGWPAGTYILHIQTPLGISTKRLVVAR